MREPDPSGASGCSTAASEGSADSHEAEKTARAVALRLLTRAPRSRAELARAIERKGVPDDIAAVVLDRFTDVGLVDDVEYAHMIVRTRHADRGLARRAIGVELRRRGIDPEVALGALDQVADEDEEVAARALVARRLVSSAGLDPQVRARRVVAALARKGYAPTLAARLVREALATEGHCVQIETTLDPD